MKKNDNRGFMMAEVIVVSAIVLIVLGTLFISYNKLLSIYRTRVKYYDTVSLYRLGFFRDILVENDVMTKWQKELRDSGNKILEVYAGEQSTSRLSLPSDELSDISDMVYLIYNQKSNISESMLKSKTNDSNYYNNFNATFKDYIKFLSSAVDLTDTNYVMLIERCNVKETTKDNGAGKNVKDDCKYAYMKAFDGTEGGSTGGAKYVVSNVQQHVGQAISGGTYSDYNAAINSFGHNFFIRHNMNGNTIASSLVGFKKDGSLFYLISDNGGKSYGVNISEMNRAFGVNSNSSSTINADGYTEYAGALANEKCVDYGTYYECTATNASNNVIINVIARINGNVRANDNTHECYSAMINTNGIQSSKCGLNPALEPQ